METSDAFVFLPSLKKYLSLMGSYYWQNFRFNQLSIQFWNIQNKHRHIKNINSFINSGLQRKPRKFAENPISGSRVPRLWSRVSGPTYGLGPGFRVLSPTFRVAGLGFRIPPTVPGLGSHFLDMPSVAASEEYTAENREEYRV